MSLAQLTLQLVEATRVPPAVWQATIAAAPPELLPLLLPELLPPPPLLPVPPPLLLPDELPVVG
jgi:hypothetical protein